jgi:short-subunit dehydrogenase involved in D-alanine esterification of teichoic acids
MKSCMDPFIQFYLKKFNSRKLIFNLDYGNALVEYRKDKNYKMTVSTRQACILMLFNVVDRLSVKMIMDHLNVTFKEIENHINSLGMKNLLKKVEKKPLKEESEIECNSNFISPNVAFTLVVAESKKTVKEV